MSEIGKGSSGRKTYLVVALACSAATLQEIDQHVAGVYSVEVSSDCPSPATAALDAFHESVAIDCLDDFEIHVVDLEAGRLIDEVEGAESYSMGSQADFHGRTEWPRGQAEWDELFDKDIPIQ